jgi:hypothetical protein
MKANTLDLTMTDNTVAMIVGHSGMVLQGDYHPDQEWFDFMCGTTLVVPTDSSPPKKHKKPHSPKWARVPEENRQLYVYEKGVHQQVLPFPDHLKVSVKQYGRLNAVDFPSWERTSGGELLWVRFAMNRRKEVEEWCRINCTRRYHVKNSAAIFESSRDAVLAKLLYHDERLVNASIW